MENRRLFVWLLLATLAWRLAWSIGAHYVELDGAIYGRAAGDYARHFATGDWRTVPWTGANYAAVEYWPPLYPLLAGTVAAVTGCSPEDGGRVVSFAAGWLLVPIVVWLGRRLFGEREGLWAGAFVGFYPPLVWYATVPRSDMLYVSLFCLTAALAFDERPAWAGVCAATAYLTRFEALLAAAICLAAALLLRATGGAGGGLARGARFVALFLVGFVLVALPYWIYLAGLNGGRPTLVTPQKRLYDALEAVWVTEGIGELSAFPIRFGAPGLVSPEALTTDMLSSVNTGWWIKHSVAGLPGALAVGRRVWPPCLALLALWTTWRMRRAAAVWSLGLLLLPSVAVALATFWDPAPRYHLFTVPLLCVLAAPSAEALRLRRRVLPAWALALGVPVLLAAELYVPGPFHFDVTAPLAACFATPESAATVRWVMAEAGAVVAWAMLGRGSQWVRGLCVGTVMVAVLGAGRAMNPLFAEIIWVSAVLLLLALLTGLVEASRPSRLLHAFVVAVFVVWGANLFTMRLVDDAFTYPSSSDGLAAWLRQNPRYRKVMAASALDVLRSGHDWVSMLPPDPARMAEADAVVVLWPMPRSPIRRKLDRPPYRVVGTVPVQSWTCGEAEWRVYARTP